MTMKRIATGILLTGLCLGAMPSVFGQSFGAVATADSGKSRIVLTWYPPIPMPGEKVSLRVEYIADRAAYKGTNSAFASARLRGVQAGKTIVDKSMEMGNGYASTDVTFDEEGDAVLGIDVKTKAGTTVSGSFPVTVRQRAVPESQGSASSGKTAVQPPLKTGTIATPVLPSWIPPVPTTPSDAASSVASDTTTATSSKRSSSPAGRRSSSAPGNLAMPVVPGKQSSPLPIVVGILFVLAGGVAGWLWMRKRSQA